MFCKLGKAALEHQLSTRDGDSAQKPDSQPGLDSENVEDAQPGGLNTQKRLMTAPWTPRRPTANQLFDVIDRSGVKGASAMVSPISSIHHTSLSMQIVAHTTQGTTYLDGHAIL